MQLIAVDIGNRSTRIAVGSTGDHRWQLEVVIRGNQSLDAKLGVCELPARPAFWAISSVNESRQDQLAQWISKHRPQDRIHVISPDDISLESSVESRMMLGRDRLIAAWMAVQLHPECGPLIVVDAGTAVTIDWVDAQSVFQGGLIFPGAELSFRLLSENTSALPYLSREERVKRLGSKTVSRHDDLSSAANLGQGKSTTMAILQGVYQSQVASIVGIVNRLISSHPEPVRVYLTGGGIAEIVEFSDALPEGFPRSWIHVPDLVLRGAHAIGHTVMQRLSV